MSRIQGNVNKFALLRVQNSSDSDADTNSIRFNSNSKQSKLKPAANNTSSTKKKTRRRKKNNTSNNQVVKESIASLDDFSQPVPDTVAAPDDWETRDKDLVEKIFHDDMWKAIELSKQEFEKEQTISQNSPPTQNGHLSVILTSNAKSDESETKKSQREVKREKKKKERTSKTVSLEQFHQHMEESLPLKPETKNPTVKTFKPSNKPTGSGDFFNNIDIEVSDIRHRENSVSSTDAAAVESVFVNERISEKLGQKDTHIHDLEGEVQSWKEKYSHVKKRNQQLLVMLQQGEMKDKAEILMEVERLSLIRDELTNEVSELHQSLERERSTVSRLKSELKVTINKQGKKSTEE